ncbi:MAG: hypothetical protein JRD93_06665 [Deltaproteobacteria bacterium]|nr:hypothetical protein [Deltaproteobacteria bacterium]MBW2661659.1 hypothetical protein [Deltaproteobacteria bacterium]
MRRNIKHFSSDFMFELTKDEFQNDLGKDAGEECLNG